MKPVARGKNFSAHFYNTLYKSINNVSEINFLVFTVPSKTNFIDMFTVIFMYWELWKLLDLSSQRYCSR
jgi:hypothetical protein